MNARFANALERGSGKSLEKRNAWKGVEGAEEVSDRTWGHQRRRSASTKDCLQGGCSTEEASDPMWGNGEIHHTTTGKRLGQRNGGHTGSVGRQKRPPQQDLLASIIGVPECWTRVPITSFRLQGSNFLCRFFLPHIPIFHLLNRGADSETVQGLG
jgi:hypothetical protein